jgi:peptidoglycan/LPS O-acetylase OafA/YrhL
MQRLPGIHGLRAVAAIGVVFFHVANLVTFAAPPAILQPVIPHLFLCVPLFFMVSAFSLAYSHDKDIRKPGWVWSYLVKRLFRIAPLFYVMTAAWLYVLPQETGWRLLTDLTFTFNFVPGQHESIVWAGWSIGVEMPFYLAFPFILEHVSRSRDAIILVAVTAVISIASYLWFTGSYAKMALTSNLVYFAIGFALYRCAFDYVRRWQQIPLLSSAQMQWLGERSFSIYLLHPLVIFLLLRNGAYEPIWHIAYPFVGSWAYLACVGLTLAVLLPVSAVSYALVERPGQRLGSLIVICARKYPALIDEKGRASALVAGGGR